MIKIVLFFTFFLVALIVNAADKPATKTIPASDPLFLSSVLAETWDVRQSATQGYIDCMMSLSDVDLTDADLGGAFLTDANLDGANLDGADLTNVTWNNTTCPDATNSDNDGGTCLNDLG